MQIKNQKIKNIFLNKSKNLRLVFWLTVALLLLFSLTPRGYAQALEEEQGTGIRDQGSAVTEEPTTFPYKKKFIISSYYTPLPGQKNYVTGNYEGDVRLNGEGVHAADGTIVYPGIAAAPPRFPFGTKMKIPGFGEVAIHDRGGAIKSNRLDIWVGSGEEGLSRALGWGMRTVEVTVYGIDPNIKESVNFTDIPMADLSAFLPRTKYFKTNLALEDEGEKVRALQESLKKLGYFHTETTGYFGKETEKAVIEFQLETGVITNDQDQAIGTFGPRSRAKLEEELERRKIFTKTLALNDKGFEVEKLQIELKRLNFLGLEPTGYYGKVTQHAVFKFQQTFGVIENEKQEGAGFAGPKTLDKLNELANARVNQGRLITRTLKQKEILADRVSKEKVLLAGAVPASGFAADLLYGNRGSDVEKLQKTLKRLGFFPGRLTTQYFGDITKGSLALFQKSHGLTQSGVLDNETRKLLNKIVSPA